MTFQSLPDDILIRIIYWLTNGAADRFKSVDLAKSYYQSPNQDINLINLSATCSSLRCLIGPYIFNQVSLVRSNQIDVILKTYQSSVDKSKDKEVYAQKILQVPQFTYSFHQFVTCLECGNGFVPQINNMFPNLQVLKILDEADTVEIGLKRVKYLTINFCTLLNLNHFDSLYRLDLLIDFDQLRNKDLAIPSKFPSLKVFNLFLNKPYVINYEIVLDWLSKVTASANLTTINFRLLKSRNMGTNISYNWKIYSCAKYGYTVGHYTGLKLIEIINNVQNIGLDLLILQELIFPLGYWDKISTILAKTLTIIEPYLGTPQLSNPTKEAIYKFISSTNVTKVKFKFGEVIDQADLQALNLMADLVTYLGQDVPILKLEIEKSWSVTDEIMIRDHYNALVNDPYKNKKKLGQATTFTKLSFNSPRFRANDVYSIDYSRAIPTLHLVETNFDDSFWSVESSKLELEQYSMAPRKLSSIWD